MTLGTQTFEGQVTNPADFSEMPAISAKHVYVATGFLRGPYYNEHPLIYVSVCPPNFLGMKILE